jgi:hypothetical protein
MISAPNQPAAGKAGFTRLFAIERLCPGLPEPRRWVAPPLSQNHNMKALAKLIIPLLLIAASSSAAVAQSNIVINGSFEGGLLAGNSNIIVPPGWGWEPKGGIRFAAVPGGADGNIFAEPLGLAYQDLATIPGEAYQLHFAIAGRWPEPASVTVLWGGADVGSFDLPAVGELPPACCPSAI